MFTTGKTSFVCDVSSTVCSSNTFYLSLFSLPWPINRLLKCRRNLYKIVYCVKISLALLNSWFLQNCKFVSLTVDASAAGEGEVEATVTHYGRMVRTWRENVGVNRHRYVFVPTEPGPYDIDVRFNNERTPGKSFLCHKLVLKFDWG